MLIAEVTAEQLIMSESEIATRIDLAGPEKIITIYISEGNDPIYNNRAWNEPVRLSRVPEDWQYEYISTNTKKVSNFIDLTFLEVDLLGDADYEIVIHPSPQKDAVSGGQSVPDTLMISHQTGIGSPFHLEPDADKVVHDDWSKAVQTEIFLHELGHLLGLEHPWDKDDGDFAVNEPNELHASTRMGYNEHVSGERGWYEDIDIIALQSIWGTAAGALSIDTEAFSFSAENDSFIATSTKTKLAIAKNKSDYTIEKNGNSWKISGSDIGIDTLSGFKRIEFADGTLALDIDAGETAGQAYRLYQAAFARTPDISGVSYHMNDIEDNGLALENVANNFIASPEFKAKYGENPSDNDFIDLLYQNVLGRSADDDGLAFYKNHFNEGTMTRAAALIGFAESPENITLVAPQIEDGIWLIS